MKFIWITLILVGLLGCNSNKYFIVRHAEKAPVNKDSSAMMATNPPLSEAGKVRAIVLRDELSKENIRYFFSTNTIRTISTARPLNELQGKAPVSIYSSSRDSLDGFIRKLKAISDGNVLIVGHSNTVDDLVNRLTGRTEIPGDLLDTEYDNLFIVIKKGNRMIFKKRKYGYPSNPE